MTTTIEAPGINITDSAQDYLAELLEKQNVEGIAVRIFITQPGTPYAETCLAYCRPGEEEPTDVKLELEKRAAKLERCKQSRHGFSCTQLLGIDQGPVPC